MKGFEEKLQYLSYGIKVLYNRNQIFKNNVSKLWVFYSWYQFLEFKKNH